MRVLWSQSFSGYCTWNQKTKKKKSEWNIKTAPEILDLIHANWSFKCLYTCFFRCRYIIYRSLMIQLCTAFDIWSTFLKHDIMYLFPVYIFMMLCIWHYLQELSVYGAVSLIQPLHICRAPLLLIASFENKLSSSLTSVKMSCCCSHPSQACQTVQCRSPGDCLIDYQEEPIDKGFKPKCTFCFVLFFIPG